MKRIAKSDLSLSSFKRVPAQVISEATKLKRMTRCKLLSRRITVEKAKQVFFKDEKLFYTDPPVNKQNKAVLEVIWTDLPQEPIDRAILAFKKRLRACVIADGGHFEHQLLQMSHAGFKCHPFFQGSR